MTALLSIRNLTKSYEGAPLLDDITFDITAGEIVCLLGPSGTGKTTLLRIIAGLEDYEAGQVLFQGRDVRNVPVHERGFGLMFQDLALFPHRNVFDNIAFGLRMLTPRPSPPDISARVMETLELVGLSPQFARRDVNRLSGGEQQRVALARTLAPRPRLVMFDEPLGALDRILRDQLVDEIRALLKRLGTTALYVTHDQDEAFELAERVVILNAGHVQQIGAPVELYQHPANAFVARFLGLTNLVEIKQAKNEKLKVKIETDIGQFVLDAPSSMSDSAQYLLLRPRAVKRIVDRSEVQENIVRGRVIETHLRGGHQRVVVETEAGLMTFEWDDQVPVGSESVLELDERELEILSE